MEDNIYTAIAGVMKKVGYVQKQKSAQLSYTYASEAALIQAIRPELVEQGIVVFVKEIKQVTRTVYKSAKGSDMLNTSVVCVVEFHHAPSGTFLLVESAGEGSDVGDKSQNKALTGALKYALRQTFLIETGDDPDKDASENYQMARTWSLDQLDALLEVSAGITDTHEGARELLELSVLPSEATEKTIQSWFNHFKKAEGTDMVRASSANEAYMKAKKGK